MECSNSYINKIINGRVAPPIRKLQCICDALDITLEHFFGGIELTFMQQRILEEMDELTEEDIQLILNIILYMKKKNKSLKEKNE